jgi:hypothetical protein
MMDKNRIFAVELNIIMEENKIVIYKDENNSIQLDVKLDNGMIWVTRQQLATLFGRDYKTISKHIFDLDLNFSLLKMG